ncbi:MAG: HEAT repeat domain-containing protein [Acidobacteriota bacterium]|nr:HEAT repeat domain-containing protein [Acidobacteriota bacterium]
MKNSFTRKYSIPSRMAKVTNFRMSGFWLLAAMGLLFAGLGSDHAGVSQAQRLYGPIRVSSISSQTSASGTVITITADNALTRAQTWQDDEGYHVVLPNTVSTDSVKSMRGVKVRRVGSSLEILVQNKPGARVNAQSGHNHLSLSVDGKLVPRPTDSYFPVESTPVEDNSYSRPQQENTPLKFSSTVEDLSPIVQPAQSQSTEANSSPNITSDPGPAQLSANQIVPQDDGTTAPPLPPSQITVQGADESLLASVFSGTSVFLVLALGLFGLLVSRKLRSKQEVAPTGKAAVSEQAQQEHLQLSEAHQAQTPEVSKSLVRMGESVSGNGSLRQGMVKMPVAGPTSLYGAYRIDQEVGKLVLGQPHRIDVLASRAIDDRRAIEASLIKGVNSNELEENERRRAREALEEYGFVARQCATLLLAPDAFDRSSAARSLGEIKSPAALPFLLESLYDSESIVRNQAVVSIGELKLPSAIGALLDIARTHPDVPSALLTRTLSACSVEGLDFFDAVIPDASLLGPGDVGTIIEEITHLEPASSVEDLPETSDDERLAHALSALECQGDEQRSEALKTLAQFRVQSAVNAIARVARFDSEPAIRSLAISSLGSISHESVFAGILIGMADESREVRAAAARSLSRLSFDRADAYVRVIETADEDTIREMAKACIQAGIVSQNLDRLSSSDHRQAYETFSLICLLAKARMNEPVLDAIATHPRIDVRLKTVHLLACAGQPETFDQLRELAVKEGLADVVKTAILEAMYKLDQAQPKEDEPFDVVEHQFVETVEEDGVVTDSSETLEGAFLMNHEPTDVVEETFAVNQESETESFQLETVETTSESETQPVVPANLDEYEL